MRFVKWLFFINCLLIIHTINAQRIMWTKPKKPIVCYSSHENSHLRIPAPAEYSALSSGRTKGVKSSNFEVTYIGFTTEAQAAFQKAVDIWESILESPVTIHVRAEWAALSNGVLGSATAGSFLANFDGAQRQNVFYPVALAEKMTKSDLNEPVDIDIFAQFNSNNSSWYLGLDGAPPAGQYDLVTVVLHELGHGLGFLDSYDIDNNVATVGLQSTSVPVIYDLQLENGAAQNLYVGFESSTDGLRTQLTSNNLFYNSNRVNVANGGQPARVYAPPAFNPGSSIAHLNDATFDGTSNALMTHAVAPGESIHDPGAIVKGMFSDMGWVFTYIDHQKLPNVENVNGPYVVKAVITSESGPVSSPKLIYSNGGALVEATMTATGIPNEYTATIPATGNPTTYFYHISVNDNLNRTYTKPGKLTSPVTGTTQQFFSFETGEDTKAPIVNHTAPGFALAADKSLALDSYISDNIGIGSANLEYSIDNIVQPSLTFQLQKPFQDSIYRASIDLGNGLPVGSIIRYRIVVTDNSSNANQTIQPASGFYVVPIEGLGQPVNSYVNNFNSPSSDFFGNGFSIATPAGFSDPAIHSEHPYINGDGFPDNKRNLVYQLKNPIKLKATDSFITFDEIALVEPGQAGAPFGSDNFFDFVVVEGSTNGGNTWIPLADGYDARAHSEWLTRYNSQADNDQNSTALADPTLFKTRTLNMLNKFKAGDTVAIRLRLFIDQFASGWGWVIDNLKIQTDIRPPVILHNHIDYVKSGENTPLLIAKALDNEEIQSFKILYFKNSEAEQVAIASNPAHQTFDVGISPLANGDKLNYKFEAHDAAGNTIKLPASGYFTITALEFDDPVSQYANNFDAVGSNDFVGNFFSIAKPAGFSTSALHSEHFYPTGFGLDSTSNLVALLKKPILLDADNPYIRFDEIAVVQGQSSTIPFGDEGFNDFVIVEGSGDNGITWKSFANGYDASSHSPWLSLFTSKGSATASAFKLRLINMLENGNFSAGDNVLVRFRLLSDAESNGWGWAIDNLFIQDAVTEVSPQLSLGLTAHPNPADNALAIQATGLSGNSVVIQLMSINGKSIKTVELQTVGGLLEHQLSLEDTPQGIYLLKVSDRKQSGIIKVLKK
jgi:hypothetical protein